jgi:hypothetical protein
VLALETACCFYDAVMAVLFKKEHSKNQRDHCIKRGMERASTHLPALAERPLADSKQATTILGLR